MRKSGLFIIFIYYYQFSTQAALILHWRTFDRITYSAEESKQYSSSFICYYHYSED